MARDLTTALKNETLAGSLAPVLLAFLDFQSGAVRVWSGVGTLTWGGNNYLGLGYLGSVSPVEESVDTVAKGLTLQITGVVNSLIATTLSDNYHGRAAKLWVAGLDGSGAVIADPYQIFSGRMDSLLLDKGVDTSTIRIGAESVLIDLQRARERRFTHEDQQIDFPGDLGLENMPTAQSAPLLWGGQKTASGAGSGGGGGSAGGGVVTVQE